MSRADRGKGENWVLNVSGGGGELGPLRMHQFVQRRPGMEGMQFHKATYV